MNERIRISQVRVIGSGGEQLGVMAPQDAVRLAREQGLDLVEVAPTTNPPVCRILDFNKFKYEQAKREREAKKKHHITRLKEIKFKPHIGDHDYQVKLQQLKRFFTRGDKVKVTVVFRGRELAHLELGQRILNRLVTDLTGVGTVERNPLLEGRFMTVIYSPDHTALKRVKRQQPPQTARATTASSQQPDKAASTGSPGS